MKLIRNTARWLMAVTLLAAPLAGRAEDKMGDMGQMDKNSALMEPVKSVLDNYLKIQTELVKDSTKGVSEHANAIAKAVRGDDMKMLSPDVTKQADALAQSNDLKSAREAFKPLSDSLIKYLKDNNAGKGVYHEVYCPMAKANWLQTGTSIQNPYLGKEMPTCGELKNWNVLNDSGAENAVPESNKIISSRHEIGVGLLNVTDWKATLGYERTHGSGNTSFSVTVK